MRLRRPLLRLHRSVRAGMLQENQRPRRLPSTTDNPSIKRQPEARFIPKRHGAHECPSKRNNSPPRRYRRRRPTPANRTPQPPANPLLHRPRISLQRRIRRFRQLRHHQPQPPPHPHRRNHLLPQPRPPPPPRPNQRLPLHRPPNLHRHRPTQVTRRFHHLRHEPREP